MNKRLSELPKIARIAIVGAVGFGILCCLLIVITSLSNDPSSSPVATVRTELTRGEPVNVVAAHVDCKDLHAEFATVSESNLRERARLSQLKWTFSWRILQIHKIPPSTRGIISNR